MRGETAGFAKAIKSHCERIAFAKPLDKGRFRGVRTLFLRRNDFKTWKQGAYSENDKNEKLFGIKSKVRISWFS